MSERFERDVEPVPGDDGHRRGDLLPTGRPHNPLDLLRHGNVPGGLRPPVGRRSIPLIHSAQKAEAISGRETNSE